MNDKTLPTLFRRLAEISLVAALYYVTARLSFLIALPPSQVTTFWPPSGLALAAVLIFGWQMGLGIWLGAFLASWGILPGPNAVPVAAVIAVGATFQAWMLAGLIKRLLKDFPPDTISGTLLAIGITALATWLTPLVGTASLCVADLALWGNYFQLALIGWQGEYISCLVFAPGLISLALLWRKEKVNEPFLWSLTCLLLGLTIFSFSLIRNADQKRLRDDLERDTTEMTSVLQEQLSDEIQALIAFRAFYNASSEVTPANFVSFTTPLLATSNSISGYEWVPRVSQTERSAYENRVRAQGFPDFFIYEKDARGNPVPAAERAEYFPVTLVEPLASNQAAVGFDLGSHPDRLQAILQARDSGEPVLSAPLQLIQSTQPEASVLILVPVYQNDQPHQWTAERRANLMGLVLGVYRVNHLAESAFQNISQHDLEFYLFDVSDPDDPRFLAFYPSISGTQALPGAEAPVLANLQTGNYQTKTIQIGGRNWLVLTRPGPVYEASASGWLAWAALLVGLLTAVGFLAYVNRRRQTEAILARSEAEFRAMSDYALTGVARYEFSSGKVIYANEATAQIFGFESPAELLNRNVRDSLSRPEQMLELASLLRTTGQARGHEIEIRTKHGEKRHLLYSATLHQEIVNVTLVDLTDRIRAGKEFQQLSRIVSQMADTVVITDIEGVIEYVNPAFEQLTGYSRFEVLGQTPRILKSGQHAQEFFAHLWHTILRGEVCQVEIINRKKNGELYIETQTISPIRNAEGVMTHFVATGKDVTERKQAEEALNESKLLLDLLIESLPQNIYAKNLEGRFIFANHLYCATEHKTLEEIVGKTDFDLHPRELAEKYRHDDQMVIETGKMLELEEEHAGLDQKSFFVQVIKTPVYDAKGQTAGTLGIFWDITERKRSEELLRQQSEQLQILYKASQRLNRTLDLSEIYQTICDFMSDLAPNDALVISAFDPTTQLITCRAYWLDQKWLEVEAFPAIPLEAEGKGTQSRVIRTGQSLLLNDFQAELKSAQANYYVNGETNEVKHEPTDEIVTQSALIVALKDGETVTGVIQVMSYQLNAYTETQLKLLEALALHIVSAEKNARLYAQVQAELNERKQVEASLRQKEADYRLIADNTSDVIWILDPELQKFVYISPSVEKLRGFTPEEVLTQPLHKALTPDSLEAVLAQLVERSAAFLERQVRMTYTDELNEVRKDGSIVPTEVSTTFVLNAAGKLQVVGISRDITARKQAESLQQAVYNIAEAAQTTESLQDLYPEIQRQVARVMPAENFFIALYDEDANLLRFPYSVDIVEPPREAIPLGKGLTAHVLQTGKSLLYLPDQDPFGIEVIGTVPAVWLGVPLNVQGKPIGAMAVQHYTDAQAFTEREKAILEFVSAQIATAIDRKQADENLRNSQASLETAQAIARLGNWELDPANGTGLFWSREMFELFQRDPAQGVPPLAEFMELIHPDDRQPLREAQAQALESGAPVTIEYRTQLAQGETQHFRATILPVWDEQGQLLRISGTVLDVTESRRLELDIRERVKELTCLFKVSRLLQDASISEDLLCQQVVEDLIQAMQFPALAVPVIELNGQRYSPAYAKSGLGNSLSALIEINGEICGKLSVSYLEDLPFILPEEQALIDNLARMLGLWSEQQQAELALRASDERFRQLANNIEEIFWIYDLVEEKITYISQAYETIWGRTCQSLYENSREYLESILPEDQPRMLAALEKQAQGERTELEYRVQRPDGSLRWVWDRSFPILAETGQLVLTAGVVTDVTERKQAEEDAAYRQRLLEKVIQLGKNITAITDLDQCLREIHQNTQLGLGFDRIGLFLYDTTTNLVQGVYGTSRAGQLEDNSWYKIPVAEWTDWQIALQSPSGIDVQPDYQACHNPPPENEMYGVKQHVTLAAWAGDKPVALITVDNLLSQRPITPADLEALQLFAGYAGLAIENARLRTGLEQRVEERTAEVRDLYDHAPTGYHSLDTNGQLLMINQTELNWLGYEREEMLGRYLGDFMSAESRTVFQHQFQLFKESGWLRDVEFEFIRKDGSRLPVLINATAVYDDQHNYLTSRSTMFDITELKKAEAAVKQSEETYRALFENANDAIFLIQQDGTILRVNERCSELLGFSTEELVGRNSLDFIVPEEVEAAHQRTLQLMSGSRLPVYERRFIRKDGVEIQTELNLSLVSDMDGHPKLIQSVVRDITERKKAQEALRESRDKLSIANADLEKASRLKDEFLASMSHELRTPLTSILGLSEALQLQTFGVLNEKQLKSLRTIESSGRHLLELINDILDLSKIEAGKLDLQFEPCQVAAVCQASLYLVKGMAQQKKQIPSFSMNPATINLRADVRRLKQMLVNLLSNAIKFTPEGGLLGLEVTADKDQKVILFSVWDKGIGIQPEDLGKLFKPFVQLDSRLSRQYSGTGLGLSLVQRVAELHGGSLQVESVPGEGSRFTILLPWSPDATQPLPSLDEPEAGKIQNALIIEDDDLDIELVSRYLQALGITKIIQPTINGALEKAAFLHPSAILLDLNLPDGSGFDLLTKLKADQRTQEIPVIIASVEERRSEAKQLGALGYLVKPYSQQDLSVELAKAAAFTRPNEPVLVIGARDSAPLIMIADDNEQILDMIASFLEAKGCRVVAVRSGFELLERAPELHPDLMLVDIQMPGMDGLETIRHLRAHSDLSLAATPIIAITALAMTGDREKCLQAGANEYLSKPIVLVKLLGLITQFLKGKR